MKDLVVVIVLTVLIENVMMFLADREWLQSERLGVWFLTALPTWREVILTIQNAILSMKTKVYLMAEFSEEDIHTAVCEDLTDRGGYSLSLRGLPLSPVGQGHCFSILLVP